MLISVQRVRRDEPPGSAVQVYCFRHDPGFDPSDAVVAFGTPCELVGEVSSGLSRGENEVLSYFDAAAREGTSTRSFAAALESLRAARVPPPRGEPLRLDSWWFRYDMNAERGERWRDELADLFRAYFTSF